MCSVGGGDDLRFAKIMIEKAHELIEGRGGYWICGGAGPNKQIHTISVI